MKLPNLLFNDGIKKTYQVRFGGYNHTHGAQDGESGRTFLRINIACPRSVLTDGLDRLKRGTLGE